MLVHWDWTPVPFLGSRFIDVPLSCVSNREGLLSFDLPKLAILRSEAQQVVFAAPRASFCAVLRFVSLQVLVHPIYFAIRIRYHADSKCF